MLFDTDYFVTTLGTLSPDDWNRTWEDNRTIMLRRTSKRVKEVVVKMILSVVVHLSRSEILGRRPQWYGEGKVPVHSETTHGDVSPVTYHHTRNYTDVQLQDHWISENH